MSALDDKLAQWRRETDVDPSPELMTGLMALAKAPPVPSKAAGGWSLAKTALVVSALAVVGLTGLWLRPASPVAKSPPIPTSVAPVQTPSPVPVAPVEPKRPVPPDEMPAEKLPMVPAEPRPAEKRPAEKARELSAVPQDAVPYFPAVKVRRHVDGGSAPAAR